MTGARRLAGLITDELRAVARPERVALVRALWAQPVRCMSGGWHRSAEGERLIAAYLEKRPAG